MKYIIAITLLFLFFSCTEETKKNAQPKQVESRRMSMENVPNEKTKYINIYTKKTTDNNDLLDELKHHFSNEEFSLEQRKSRGGLSYSNCTENSQVKVRGNGVRDYFIRSNKPMKGTIDCFPDFVMLVYEFPTNELALQNYNLIMKTRKSKGWRLCNGITVDKIVLNGNEVFHLSTRAEMFRPYIDKYGEIIKNFQQE